MYGNPHLGNNFLSSRDYDSTRMIMYITIYGSWCSLAYSYLGFDKCWNVNWIVSTRNELPFCDKRSTLEWQYQPTQIVSLNRWITRLWFPLNYDSISQMSGSFPLIQANYLLALFSSSTSNLTFAVYTHIICFLYYLLVNLLDYFHTGCNTDKCRKLVGNKSSQMNQLTNHLI